MWRIKARYAVFTVLAVLLSPLNGVATAQPAPGEVGIYRDTGGLECSLSNNNGPCSYHIVVNPPAGGAEGVEFRAPAPLPPPRWNYDSDTTVAPFLYVGDSQTGVAIAFGSCLPSGTPVHVLTINYFCDGLAPVCTSYPVLPHPTSGSLQFVDCTMNPVSATGVPGIVNGNPDCPCGGTDTPEGAPAPAPTLSTWGLIAAAAALLAFGLFAVRRRSRV